MLREWLVGAIELVYEQHRRPGVGPERGSSAGAQNRSL